LFKPIPYFEGWALIEIQALISEGMSVFYQWELDKTLILVLHINAITPQLTRLSFQAQWYKQTPPDSQSKLLTQSARQIHIKHPLVHTYLNSILRFMLGQQTGQTPPMLPRCFS